VLFLDQLDEKKIASGEILVFSIRGMELEHITGFDEANTAVENYLLELELRRKWRWRGLWAVQMFKVYDIVEVSLVGDVRIWFV
jgi:hypothetical protein